MTIRLETIHSRPLRKCSTFGRSVGRNHLISLLVSVCLDGTITSSQTTNTTSTPKSEFIAPGVEHIQTTRGYKSEKDATGPWFINLLRIDLTKARLRLVHAMDEAVGLETVSSMAARYGALAAVNSGYFRTTGTYRGDSVGIEVLDGKILSESNNARAAVELIDRRGRQELFFGHVKFDGETIDGPNV